MTIATHIDKLLVDRRVRKLFRHRLVTWKNKTRVPIADERDDGESTRRRRYRYNWDVILTAEPCLSDVFAGNGLDDFLALRPRRDATIEEKCAFLAAIHDARCEPSRANKARESGRWVRGAPINPWQRNFSKSAEASRAGMLFYYLMDQAKQVCDRASDEDRKRIESWLADVQQDATAPERNPGDLENGRGAPVRSKPEPTFQEMREPVKVAEIARVLPPSKGGGRSDKVADRLRRLGARMTKAGGANYIEEAEAQRLLPAYRKLRQANNTV